MLAVSGSLVYAALQNDAFTDLTPPLDDTGFTHDTVLAVERDVDDYRVGGRFFHRMITSTIDRRRWDQLDVLATGERAWPHLIITARLGPTFGGNLGGRYVQNGWHSLSGTGPTIDQGLANTYPGDHTFGLVAGGRARAETGNDRALGYAHLDMQAGLGAGVSSIDTTVGGRAATHHVGIHAALAVTRYHVADDNLALPGGYGSGWQLEWRAGIDVSWSRYRISYEYRANEGGSGEPIGVIAFAVVR